MMWMVFDVMMVFDDMNMFDVIDGDRYDDDVWCEWCSMWWWWSMRWLMVPFCWWYDGLLMMMDDRVVRVIQSRIDITPIIHQSIYDVNGVWCDDGVWWYEYVWCDWWWSIWWWCLMWMVFDVMMVVNAMIDGSILLVIWWFIDDDGW